MREDSLCLPEPFATRVTVRPQRRQGLTLATLCAAVLIAQVDTSVVNLAVRAIGNDFRASVGTLQWVVDGYNWVYAVLLLSGGLLADLYGRRRVFMAGAAMFTTSSLLCAFAPTVTMLIGGRLLTGAGAALLLPSSLAILRVAWPDPRARGRALGIWTGCNGLAMAIGPTLGGLMIDRFGWRSIFLMVVPLGLAALALAPLAVPESADPRGRHFDGPAQGLGMLGLGGFTMAAIESQRAPALAAIALIVALLAAALFIRVEARRGPAALVPLVMFRIRPFRGAMAATAGMTFGMYGLLFLLLLAWQSTGRFGAAGAGIALMPMALAFVVVSPFSGALTERWNSRPMIGGGLAAMACGLAVIGLTARTASVLPAEVGLTLAGAGMGLATGPLMGLAVGAVAAARAGTAAALVNVARMAGATLGVAILGAVFAIGHGGAEGLRLALLLGAAVQVAAAVVVWTGTPDSMP